MINEFFNKKISIKKNILIISALIYVYIPVFIFLLTWYKLPFGISATSVLLLQLVLLIKKYRNDECLNINVYIILFVVIATFLLHFLLGTLGFGLQTEDHPKINAVFNDLLNYKWPVIYQSNNSNILLTYYIGQYIVPSFLSKVFGLQFEGLLVLNYIWVCIGYIIISFLILSYIHVNILSKVILTLIIVLGFSPLHAIIQKIGHIFYPDQINLFNTNWRDYFLTYGKYMLQNRSMFMSMRWVYTQMIAQILTVFLFLENKDKFENYIFITIPLIMHSTWGALSMVCIEIVYAIVAVIKNKTNIIKIFSISNFISIYPLLIICLYFFDYIVQKKPLELGFSFVVFNFTEIPIYIYYLCLKYQ